MISNKKDSGNNIVSEIHITMRQNGSVDVTGPINNFPLFRHMMNAAERAVLESIATKFKTSQIPGIGSRLVT